MTNPYQTRKLMTNPYQTRKVMTNPYQTRKLMNNPYQTRKLMTNPYQTRKLMTNALDCCMTNYWGFCALHIQHCFCMVIATYICQSLVLA